MTLKAQLTEDMKTAMKAGEKDRLGVIRLINAAIKQKEVDERIEMTDELVLAVLEKMLKQRKDSISQFEAAGRNDLADIEKFESGVIQAYLPQALSQEEIEALVGKAIAETGADIVFLQEIHGTAIKSDAKRRRFSYPDQPHFEYLANEAWPHFAYGRNVHLDMAKRVRNADNYSLLVQQY